MTTAKAIVISEAPAEALSALMAELDLPRRALSLPVEPNAADGLPCFIELWGDREAVREVAVDWPFPSRAWLVAEYIPFAYDRTWPSGQPSPGLRRVSTIHRRAGMSRSEFEKHWRGPHTEIAKSYTLPVWHYNQNVVVEALSPGCDEDGFVGMHFRTADDLRARWQDHPIEAARGAKDAALFMTLERSVSMTAIETVWDTRR